MAVKWLRNGREDDVAWWLDEDEERMLLASYSLIDRFAPKYDTWRLGFEEFFVSRGLAVTDKAIRCVNHWLRKKGWPEVELLETVADDDRPHPSHVADRRRWLLDEMEAMDAEAKLAEIERIKAAIRAKRGIPAYCPTTAPSLDERTIRFLIDAAPDGATAAWLSAHLGTGGGRWKMTAMEAC